MPVPLSPRMEMGQRGHLSGCLAREIYGEQYARQRIPVPANTVRWYVMHPVALPWM